MTEFKTDCGNACDSPCDPQSLTQGILKKFNIGMIGPNIGPKESFGPQPLSESCPHCGYCPRCGRSNISNC